MRFVRSVQILEADHSLIMIHMKFQNTYINRANILKEWHKFAFQESFAYGAGGRGNVGRRRKTWIDKIINV